MATIKVLIVEPSGECREEEIKNDFRAFQSAVGGYIEGIFGSVSTIYVNEEGRIHGLPLNSLATEFAQFVLERNVLLVGTALIVGPSDTEGNDTDVRPAVVDYFTKEK